MAQFVEWNPALALGIPMIDEQHKKLVELCNELYAALMDTDTPTENKEIIKEAVRACTEYVNYHFSSEERLLLAAEYADFAEHKKAHDEFIKRILQAVKEYENADFKVALDFVKFIYEWIFEHIAHVDKLYVPKVIEAVKMNAARGE